MPCGQHHVILGDTSKAGPHFGAQLTMLIEDTKWLWSTAFGPDLLLNAGPKWLVPLATGRLPLRRLIGCVDGRQPDNARASPASDIDSHWIEAAHGVVEGHRPKDLGPRNSSRDYPGPLGGGKVVRFQDKAAPAKGDEFTSQR